MVVHGHLENGVIIPHQQIPLPDGTEVTIMVREQAQVSSGATPHEQRSSYLAALARIDAIENENPGDDFRGADHDRVLYG